MTENIYYITPLNIAHDTIDGETIIVNAENGVYYSTKAIGTIVWQLLINQQMSVTQINDILQSQYPDEKIKDQVLDFIGQLKQEDLIVDSDKSVSERNIDDLIGELQTLPFSPLQLEKKSEVSDLLLIDPIHDVDDTGWPNRPKEKESRLWSKRIQR